MLKFSIKNLISQPNEIDDKHTKSDETFKTEQNRRQPLEQSHVDLCDASRFMTPWPLNSNQFNMNRTFFDYWLKQVAQPPINSLQNSFNLQSLEPSHLHFFIQSQFNDYFMRRFNCQYHSLASVSENTDSIQVKNEKNESSQISKAFGKNQNHPTSGNLMKTDDKENMDSDKDMSECDEISAVCEENSRDHRNSSKSSEESSASISNNKTKGFPCSHCDKVKFISLTTSSVSLFRHQAFQFSKRSLTPITIWQDTCQSILALDRLYAKYAAKAFDRPRRFAVTKSSTQVKSRTSAKYASKHSTEAQRSTPTWEYMMSTSHGTANTAEKVFTRKETTKTTSSPILAWNSSRVRYVPRHFIRSTILNFTCTRTVSTSRIVATCAAKVSVEISTWKSTRAMCTLCQGHI